ncbi:MAG TPA: undecaprenyldiphospho-muramoylpentapeptide beta-N-acetylglucosaminyltransferase [Pseudogracilibacillus sp.]|nr:undecaprenyldiphospho-muramoylpentapeptide beta-N-acetylglucosaminyltransferase [Pseudogracilibacillus sp.]
MKEKRITFTGGGTAGHVIVNLALIPYFLEKGWKVDYIGSKEGIERELINQIDDITYYPISTGKLRRYMSLENMKDPFRVLKGVAQAWKIIRKTKPNVVFSKGGFVSVPVVVGARFRRVPTIIHESDISPGLANKLAAPFAKQMLTTFPETVDHVKKKNTRYVGPIIREELFTGDKTEGYRLTNFTREKPVLLIMGGSIGSQKINEAIRSILPNLLSSFQLLHICGKGNVDESINELGYAQFEYVNDELKHLFSIADYVISRAGANAIFELLALQLPMLLIPLSLGASRGDQIENAQSFANKEIAHVMEEEEMTSESLLEAIHKLVKDEVKLKKQMAQYNSRASRDEVIKIIKDIAK